MKKLNTRDLVYIAMYAAIFVVLDRLTDTVNLFKMPNGGKMNLATVALLLSSYHLGWQKGLITGGVCCVLMLATGSISFYGIVSLLLDYLLAYMGYGMAGYFKNYGVFYSGILITSLFRLLCSTLSGTLVWETPLWGSFTYNLSYLLPTFILDIIAVPLLYKALKPVISRD